MRRGASRAVVLGALLSVLGCGGEGPTGPNVVIEMQSQALLDEAALLAIYFYGADRTCEDLRATMPRPTSVLGPYRADLDDAGRSAGVLIRQDAVPVGTYTLFVDALDVNGRIVGIGCSPDQRVLEREVASIKVVVRDP